MRNSRCLVKWPCHVCIGTLISRWQITKDMRIIYAIVYRQLFSSFTCFLIFFFFFFTYHQQLEKTAFFHRQCNPSYFSKIWPFDFLFLIFLPTKGKWKRTWKYSRYINFSTLKYFMYVCVALEYLRQGLTFYMKVVSSQMLKISLSNTYKRMRCFLL